MYGSAAYSESAYSDLPWTPIDSSAFQAFLAQIASPRCWLLELDAFSLALTSAQSAGYGGAAYGELGYDDAAAGVTGGVQTLRFSSDGYTSQAADSPSTTWYDARLVVDSIKVARQLAGKSGIGGLTRVFAELKLLNSDGGFDAIPGNYAIDGRKARILVGRLTDPLSSFGLVFSGVSASVEVGLAEVLLKLSDGAAKLDIPLNANTYGGTGGLDGGSDLTGKPKPKCWGHAFNVSPPLVDSVNLIYQVHDGVISDVPAVYDRGVSLAKVGGAPAAGQYQVNPANGTFTLGATPAGTVTCDVLGDASLVGYINRTSDIVLRILLQQANLTSSEIDPASFANMNTDAPAEVGIYIGTDGATIADVVDELLANVGAFGGFSRSGAFTVGVIRAADGALNASFTQDAIVDIVRAPLPAPVAPIVWRATVGYQKSYTVQPDLAASVSASRRSFAAQELRTVKAEDAAIRSRYLLAVEYGPVDGLFAQQADAATEAARLFALWNSGRAPFDVTLPIVALTLDLGDAVQLTHPRLGFNHGKAGRVIGQEIDGSDVKLTVLA